MQQSQSYHLATPHAVAVHNITSEEKSFKTNAQKEVRTLTSSKSDLACIIIYSILLSDYSQLYLITLRRYVFRRSLRTQSVERTVAQSPAQSVERTVAAPRSDLVYHADLGRVSNLLQASRPGAAIQRGRYDINTVDIRSIGDYRQY